MRITVLSIQFPTGGIRVCTRSSMSVHTSEEFLENCLTRMGYTRNLGTFRSIQPRHIMVESSLQACEPSGVQAGY